jgi:Putative addiction module component
MPIKDMASFETEALTLPATKRAILAKHLLASLDDLNEQENEQMWLDEADRRYQAYKDGSLPARDAFEAITEARERL